MNPFSKFNKWFNLAKKEYEYDHTAFALSTCEENKPFVRMVLLKKILNDGYVFFTNLKSDKGKQFLKNNNLAMCFYWPTLDKQVRIVGKGEIIKEIDSDSYFSTRLRGSQIGAWASEQSSNIKNRKYLISRYKNFEKKFKNMQIPRPPHWVGVKVVPREFEFWQNADYRLHKREVFFLKNKTWCKKILSP